MKQKIHDALAAMKLANAKQFLRQYYNLERKATDEAGWLMLKMGLDRTQAESLIATIKKGTP